MAKGVQCKNLRLVKKGQSLLDLFFGSKQSIGPFSQNSRKIIYPSISILQSCKGFFQTVPYPQLQLAGRGPGKSHHQYLLQRNGLLTLQQQTKNEMFNSKRLAST